MSDTTIQLKPNGPYLVTGPCTLLDENGNKLPTGEKIWLCRCGASATKPICDGSHKTACPPAPK
ncbi:MAG TPA: CDGSH iron-sulfur domain-containing protein [Tepidisphaeraceae bacterium]|nr:CDGSH iron-sulfur domain-containing protein [Tepidisphaeraceae bacterium]